MVSYLQIEKLSKSFGDRLLFADITFGVYEGDKIGIVARNGDGKRQQNGDRHALRRRAHTPARVGLLAVGAADFHDLASDVHKGLRGGLVVAGRDAAFLEGTVLIFVGYEIFAHGAIIIFSETNDFVICRVKREEHAPLTYSPSTIL